MNLILRGRPNRKPGTTSLVALVVVVVLLSIGWIFAQTGTQPTPPDLHSTTPGAPAVTPDGPAAPPQSPAAPPDTSSDTASNEPSASPKLDDVLQNFLTHAYYHGRAELYLAQMASTRAINPDVKGFAGTVISDHSRVDRELFSLARKKGLKIDREFRVDENPLYKEMLSQLSQLSGPEFDVAYIEQTAENHTLELEQYLHLAATASDGDTQLFAAQQVSRVRDRLRRAQQILKTSEHQVTAQAFHNRLYFISR
jgi:putative membrane protein